ncbi:b3621fe5-76f2-4528-af2b-83d8d1ad461d [Thermothielavioides terrestris]|uniref:SET domain-containing protein n=2 Tax=Thermothielavioides terrestris TaxID=2587410 RepID=G2R418_THETT|nr:uncharacterized protein THITE_2111880 [Thermothielavioides terrestris NRRL 8126]AEO65160.1 hypothetical protein THITE_2111880 [Thermothielavioides terrestris NRRL 8126]SPQ19589.1 b3621fe5-76f2-4528-af2b-83d8d1ad461d [Thermothielavioides terrestris]
MEAYDELLRWAQDRGVEIHGIAPREIPGKGVGMVATKPLKANERLLHVPTSALRSLETIRPKVKKALPADTRVHALLAADLALDKPTTKKYAPWNAIVPSAADLATALPLAWSSPVLHNYLPPPARALLRAQQAKFARDWAAVSAAFPALAPDAFRHAWLLTNTRTFYHETARTARLPHDDRMVLQPVADLFNHAADGGCEVAFTPASFAITADRAYAEGEEVLICYGRHSNDFLLVEYGFVLEQNRWDEVGLDEAVLPELGEEEKRLLEEKGFLGGYVLDAKAVCYRTLVALRLLCVPRAEWERLVAEGEDGGEKVQAKVDRLLLRILCKYRRTVEGTIKELEGLEDGEPCQREILRVRWQQIRALIDQTIERLEY